MPRDKTPADGKPRDPKPVPSSPGQPSIDFTRAEQLAILGECVLPPQYVWEGKRRIKVSSVVLKSMLKAIDSYSRGRGDAWPSIPTLAAHCGISPRAAARAIKALEENLSVITCETKVPRFVASNGKPVNHYRLVWTELATRRPTCHSGSLLRKSSMPQAQSSMPQAQSSMPQAQSSMPPVAFKAYETDEAYRNVSSSSSPPNPKRVQADAGVEEEEESFAPEGEPPAADAAAARPTWQQAAAAMKAIGIKCLRRALHLAQRNGMNADVLLDIVRFYELQLPGTWDIPERASNASGVVFWVINEWLPGQAADDPTIWPSPRQGRKLRTRESPRPAPAPTVAAEPERPIDLFAVAQHFISRGRSKRQTDDEIRATLRTRGLPETLLDPQPQEPVA